MFIPLPQYKTRMCYARPTWIRIKFILLRFILHVLQSRPAVSFFPSWKTMGNSEPAGLKCILHFALYTCCVCARSSGLIFGANDKKNTAIILCSCVFFSFPSSTIVSCIVCTESVVCRIVYCTRYNIYIYIPSTG